MESVASCMEKGALDYLIKPIRIQVKNLKIFKECQRIKLAYLTHK
jgi:response regulator of citrate/malate metabolism